LGIHEMFVGYGIRGMMAKREEIREAVKKAPPKRAMSKRQDIIKEGMWEFILEVRQYLCSTEFAPEPFFAPVDIDLLRGMGEDQLKKMATQGVVIKVGYAEELDTPFGEPCMECPCAIAVEPLIKEMKREKKARRVRR